MNPAAHVHVRRAIALAAEARAQGDPPFGSLLVSDEGVVLVEARNTTATGRDVTAHPELTLARWAGRELTAAAARTTTMYTSCEPCSMCAGAMARAHIGRVVFALSIADLRRLQPVGFAGPDPAAIRSSGPLLVTEAEHPVQGFYL